MSRRKASMPDSKERGKYVYLPSDLNRKERKERKEEYSCLSILCAPCALCGQFTSPASQRFSVYPTSGAAAGIVLNDPCLAGGVTYGVMWQKRFGQIAGCGGNGSTQRRQGRRVAAGVGGMDSL